MNKKISRRYLIKMLAMAAVGMGAGCTWFRKLLQGTAQELDKFVYLPVIDKSPTYTPTPMPTPTATATTSPPPTGSRVVHVHSDQATFWDFGDDYYGDFVDQNTVDAMVDRGVMELTGISSLAQAWQSIIPNYAPGEPIAIKVNFNNCWQCDRCRTGCEDWQLATDALIHPINAIVRGLLQAYPGFNTSDVWVYDATNANDPRQIPGRFKNGCLYPGVRYFDRGCNEMAGYTSTDPTAVVAWRNPSNIPTPPSTQVTDVLVNTDYLINMPIIKKHVGKGVTLSFKNHFGSIDNCANIHDWVGNGSPYYGGNDYNPMVDIFRNQHILDKTVLTVGDALFGNWENNWGKSSPWTTFGGKAANSLLFSTDPVSIDCVMCDLLHAEQSIWGMSDDHLVYAAACGLGTYERGDPWGSGYDQIDYLKVEL